MKKIDAAYVLNREWSIDKIISLFENFADKGFYYHPAENNPIPYLGE